VLQIDERPHQEPGADEQRQREGQLTGHDELANPQAHAADPGQRLVLRAVQPQAVCP
jgi:hypothetical protein